MKFTMPHPTQMSTTCDANDPSCTSSSHSSYSYVQRDGKTNVVHKESFVRKRKNDEGKTVVERKKVDYETKDGKTVKDVFQHYEIDQDAKGKFVSIKDPAGKTVYKGYIDGKLSTRENAKHIAALIKRHRQTLEPSLHSGSSRAVVATGSKRDNESATLASMVQNELDGTMHEQTRSGSGETSATRSPSRRASSSRKRSRSSSSSSETSSAHRHSRRASSSHKKPTDSQGQAVSEGTINPTTDLFPTLVGQSIVFVAPCLYTLLRIDAKCSRHNVAQPLSPQLPWLLGEGVVAAGYLVECLGVGTWVWAIVVPLLGARSGGRWGGAANEAAEVGGTPDGEHDEEHGKSNKKTTYINPTTQGLCFNF